MAYTTIDKPTDYFNTKLYTGTGSTHNITGVGFQPDWVWIKSRSDAYAHYVFDVVRGATKQVQTNLTDPEATSANQLTSFDSDGFTLGTDIVTNGSSKTFASWNWLAGGTASSNTDGSITSSVSANTTAGFSIVSYTGTGSNATVGHGLGVAPSMYIVKNRSDNDSWGVYHKSLGATKYLRLQGTDASATSSVWWNDTEPTSSVFSVGTAVATNSSSENLIAYCFAEKKSFSKFGSYTSNNNADGPMIWTGFKPAFLLLKNSSEGGTGWEIYDNKRTPTNVANLFLRANTTEADISSDRLDILSNGFKLRQVGDTNYSNNNIIYMAFAENPFVTSTGIPTTAR